MQAGGAKNAETKCKRPPRRQKKRSKVWRVVTTIPIVLAALLLLAAALIRHIYRSENEEVQRPESGDSSTVPR